MLTNIKNQPVQFNLPDLGKYDSEYHQLITEDDKLNFQIGASFGDNIVTNYLNWGTFSGTITSETLTWSGAQNANKNILTLGTYYKCEITILNMPIGSYLNVNFGTGVITQLTSTGTFEIYATCANDTIFQMATNSTANGLVVQNDVKIYALQPNSDVIACDYDGNPVETLWGYTDIVRGNVRYTDKDLPSFNCFLLKIFTNYEEEYNNTFSSGAGWTLSGVFAISGGTLNGEDVTGVDDYGEFEYSVSDTTVYEPSVTIDNLSDVEFDFVIFDDDSNELYREGFSTVGVNTLPQIALAPGDYIMRIEATDLAQTNTFDISEMSLFAYTDEDMVSNTFGKITNTDRTILFTASDDEDVYGFEMDDDFTFNLRMIASKHYPNDQTESESIKYSNGVMVTRYSDSEEVETISTDFVPNYIHAALRKMRLMQDFYIDGEKYVINDDGYSTGWERGYNLAPAEFEVKYYNQNYRNINS